MTDPDETGDRAGGPSLSVLAQRWASAIAWTSYVPMARAERLAALTRFAERLAAALVAEPFTDRPGYEVGTGLVRADFAAPETLGSTIQVIDQHLLAAAAVTHVGLATTTPETRHRLSRLLGGLATGSTWALRDRPLDQQEAIRPAAFVAREQAEVALRESEARFRHAALHDPLTGMPNRAYFSDRLAAIFSTASPESRIG